MSAKRMVVPWNAVYGSELERRLTWEEMKTKWHRERQAQRYHVRANHPIV